MTTTGVISAVADKEKCTSKITEVESYLDDGIWFIPGPQSHPITATAYPDAYRIESRGTKYGSLIWCDHVGLTICQATVSRAP